MTIRRSIFVVTALVIASTSCSALRNKSSESTGVFAGEPLEPMTATRRRPGSDVTTRDGGDKRGAVAQLLPCGGDTSSVRRQFDRDCREVVREGEELGRQMDSTSQKRP
jgi:hypothetical protein